MPKDLFHFVIHDENVIHKQPKVCCFCCCCFFLEGYAWPWHSKFCRIYCIAIVKCFFFVYLVFIITFHFSLCANSNLCTWIQHFFSAFYSFEYLHLFQNENERKKLKKVNCNLNQSEKSLFNFMENYFTNSNICE